MARNEEKAQSMLNRFLAGKQGDARGPKAKRPYLASECRDLVEADKWRSQIIREVGKKAVLDWEEREMERQAALSSVAARGGGAGGGGGEGEEERFIAYVPLPDQQAIEAKILEMKRSDLLSKYTSEALVQQQASARSLLNKK
ncbi:Pre-mRNA-splicing factor ISY1 [Tetrabaena socialis]|uniref:Pre-mRNA-splicing factor ISY1 n=1 Tax=Tetrabaena socialis TaxID=47790 RepID=A0A2J8A8C7_9CHLO|nr:Pre-mRNA-splicing factor ISY1 [Tetrabaena socialis]|eukprot:PNH08768.1 Pre-mRNA-splicing factor ISY1 [Tetrabaena socialis]